MAPYCPDEVHSVPPFFPPAIVSYVNSLEQIFSSCKKNTRLKQAAPASHRGTNIKRKVEVTFCGFHEMSVGFYLCSTSIMRWRSKGCMVERGVENECR